MTEGRNDPLGSAGWLLRRWLPALLLAGAAGALLGWLRAALFFLPGIQGMAAGGAAGWIAGRMGRGDPARFWTFGQRLWLSLGLTLAFGAAHLAVLSVLLAGPLDAPLTWLLEILDGSGREPFLGLARFTTHSGFLEGGWWIGLNLLDLLLFAFLSLVCTGVGLFPDRPGEAEGEGGTTEVEDEPDPVVAPRGSRSALLGCLSLGVLQAAAGLGYHHAYHRRDDPDFTLQGLERLRALAGTWRLEDGGGLFGPRGSTCLVSAEAGLGSLTLKPEDGRPPEKSPADLQALLRGERGTTWRLNLSPTRGRDFSGLLFFHGPGSQGRMPVPVRARFSEDRALLTLAWSIFPQGGRREITVRGKRAGPR